MIAVIEARCSAQLRRGGRVQELLDVFALECCDAQLQCNQPKI